MVCRVQPSLRATSVFDSPSAKSCFILRRSPRSIRMATSPASSALCYSRSIMPGQIAPVISAVAPAARPAELWKTGPLPRFPQPQQALRRRAHRLRIPARRAPGRCPTQTGGSVKVKTDGEWSRHRSRRQPARAGGVGDGDARVHGADGFRSRALVRRGRAVAAAAIRARTRTRTRTRRRKRRPSGRRYSSMVGTRRFELRTPCTRREAAICGCGRWVDGWRRPAATRCFRREPLSLGVRQDAGR